MSSIGPYFSLTKPRVVVLLQITALCSVLAHDQLGGGVDSDSMRTMLVVFVGGYLSAGGANAINMWYDKDIDPLMSRTKNRPVPSGEVTAEAALAFGVALSVLGVYWFWELANPVAAVWSAFSILFYVFVYSIWLKRSTPQNIVIGGAAGAFPPMIGWAAATGSVSVEAILMFSLTFMWTPPHFWALALFMRSDYDDAGVPMLTVTHGRRSTRVHILVYTLLLAALAVGTAFTSVGGPVYLAVALVLNALFIKGAWDIFRRDEAASETDNYKTEKRFFKLSLLYLFAHFGAILVEAGLSRFGLGGW